MSKKKPNSIDYVGSLIPEIIRIVQATEHKGDPLFCMAYGMYDLRTGPIKKFKLALKNGRGKRKAAHRRSTR